MIGFEGRHLSELGYESKGLEGFEPSLFRVKNPVPWTVLGDRPKGLARFELADLPG